MNSKANPSMKCIIAFGTPIFIWVATSSIKCDGDRFCNKFSELFICCWSDKIIYITKMITLVKKVNILAYAVPIIDKSNYLTKYKLYNTFMMTAIELATDVTYVFPWHVRNFANESSKADISIPGVNYSTYVWVRDETSIS
eukprot:Mrub_07234.p2 GENE.Mrub_07234~~Mrub_07234.p2  ORF type:complete len:141 (-),score=3.10 Mrub_07234:58-480(-)